MPAVQGHGRVFLFFFKGVIKFFIFAAKDMS